MTTPRDPDRRPARRRTDRAPPRHPAARRCPGAGRHGPPQRACDRLARLSAMLRPTTIPPAHSARLVTGAAISLLVDQALTPALGSAPQPRRPAHHPRAAFLRTWASG